MSLSQGIATSACKNLTHDTEVCRKANKATTAAPKPKGATDAPNPMVRKTKKLEETFFRNLGHIPFNAKPVVVSSLNGMALSLTLGAKNLSARPWRTEVCPGR